MNGDGLLWMGCAALITFIPICIVGLVARSVFKVNYLTLCGVLAGSMTDPPALAFANSINPSQAQSTAYAAVYPLTMCLRILAPQLILGLLWVIS
jgi:putative transport protein